MGLELDSQQGAAKPPTSGGTLTLDSAASTPQPKTTSDTFDVPKLQQLWITNGGDPSVAPLMAHIAYNGESSGNPNAINSYVENGKTYHVHGLWQISDIHGPGNYNDPNTNARAAIKLYNSVKLAPWEASRSKWQQYVNDPSTGTLTLDKPGHLQLDKSGKPTQSATPTPPAATPSAPPLYHAKGDPTLPGAMPKPLSIAAHAFNVANQFVVEAKGRALDSAAEPLQAAQNVELTPARFLDTFVAHGVSGPTIGSAFYNALNPGVGDEGYTTVAGRIGTVTNPLVHAILQDSHLGASDSDIQQADDWADKLSKAHAPQIPTPPPGTDPFEIGRKINQGLAALPTLAPLLSPTKFEHLLSGFISQSLADPVTFFPVVGALAKTAEGTRALTAVSDAAKVVGGTKAAAPLVRSARAINRVYGKLLDHAVRPLVGTRTELDKFLETHAKGARLGFENWRQQELAPMHDANHALIDKYNKELESYDSEMSPDVYSLGGREGTVHDKLRLLTANVPDEMKQNILGHVYKFGDQQMRHTALRLGYDTAPDDIPITSLSKGELSSKDYGKILSKQPEANVLQRVFPELYPHGTKPSLGKLVGSYLFNEHNALWQGRADSDTLNYLRAHGGWKGDGPPDVSKLSHGPNEGYQRWERSVFGPEGSPLRMLGKWGTQAVQGVPFAHGINNVGTLEYLKSPIAVGRAIGYMAKPPSEEQALRLSRMGSFAEYTSDPGTIWTKAPVLGEALGVGQETLSRMELAYRQGLLDELDRTLGPSIDEHGNITDLRLEMKKGQEIRDALVDYKNVPLVVAWMQAAGAPFSPFLAGLTKAVGQAAVRNPERIATMIRGDRNVQDTYGESFPNPVNTAAELLFDPAHTIANHLGLLGSGFTKSAQSGYPSTLADDIAQGVRSAGGPLLSRVPAFLNEPYNAPGTQGVQPTPVQGILNLLTGAYPYQPPNPRTVNRRERDIEKQEAPIFPENL